MTFPDIAKTLKHLDRLEGYRPGCDSHYLRIEKAVTILEDGGTLHAWCYVYPDERLRPDFIPVLSGDWNKATV